MPPAAGKHRPPKRLARRIGARIRALRKEAGLTQEAVAWRVDLSKNHLSQIEAGKRTPSLAVLFKLAARLGGDAIDLVAIDPASPRTALVDAIRKNDRKAAAEALDRLGLRDDG